MEIFEIVNAGSNSATFVRDGVYGTWLVCPWGDFAAPILIPELLPVQVE